MTTYRIFKRPAWQINKSWPDGFEPLSVCASDCRTIITFDNQEYARAYCKLRNTKRPDGPNTTPFYEYDGSED